MTTIVGFCAAKANSGKTTLLLSLVEKLHQRGISVAVLKHGRHMTESTKDSSRHAASGAAASMFVTESGWILESHPAQELPLDEAAEILTRLTGCSLILVEGYKKAAIPKIAVCRSDISLELPCPKAELLAVVSDAAPDIDLPCFGFEELDAIVDLILAQCNA